MTQNIATDAPALDQPQGLHPAHAAGVAGPAGLGAAVVVAVEGPMVIPGAGAWSEAPAPVHRALLLRVPAALLAAEVERESKSHDRLVRSSAASLPARRDVHGHQPVFGELPDAAAGVPQVPAH